MCHCWKYACIIDFSLKAGSSVIIEDVAVLGECCPSGRDSSLNLLVLIFIFGAVSLSLVDAAFNVFYLSGVDLFIFRP